VRAQPCCGCIGGRKAVRCGGDHQAAVAAGGFGGFARLFDQNQGTPLSLDNVIPGFAEGLQLMPRGSVYRLCVPATLGYGAAGAGEAIPANADLVFQIELVDFKTAAEVEAMRKAQEAGEAKGAPAAPAAH
jgi:FKBP-type peptidyl-prolyl cis-trans isomerase FkpA